MKYKIYNYIRDHFSDQPKRVDALLVSAFVSKNKIRVKNNKLVKSYLIRENKGIDAVRLEEFSRLIDGYFPKFGFEQLIEAFEFVISPSDKIVTGAVYTPLLVRQVILDEIMFKVNIGEKKIRISDIACGCGGFLFTAAQAIKAKTNLKYATIFKHNIFGLDIKKYSINRTKLLLSLLALSEGEDSSSFSFNLFKGDALNFKWNKYIANFSGFDIIVGNPPYVCSRKISEETKKHLHKFEVCSSGHPDLYIPFFQVGLELLSENGHLGFITMNSFFKSLNGRALRSYFQKVQYDFKIVDFDSLKIFQKKAYTCICLVSKVQSDSVEYTRVLTHKEIKSRHFAYKKIPYSHLKSFSGWNLNNPDIINKIESCGIPFSDKFKTRNGIATLKNAIYIFAPIKEDDEFYYLQNGSVFPIEKSICKSIVNPNLLTSKAELSQITEQIIFPYEFQDDEPIIFSEKKLSEEFPMTYQYLKAKRSILKQRDKGKGKYDAWFAFGRNQSLERMKHKLFFPHITPHLPNYVINSDEDMLFYNGIAVIGDNENDVHFARKLMSTRLFWYYIKNSSKPYSAGYYSLSKNYIRNFGVYPFSIEEIEYILDENNMEKLNTFIESKYQVSRLELG